MRRPSGIVAQINPATVNQATLERSRIEPPAFDTFEQFLEWQREIYKPGKLSSMPDRTIALDLPDHELAVLVRALGPLKVITPFGCVVLAGEADASS